jgi:hypothetical protein
VAPPCKVVQTRRRVLDAVDSNVAQQLTDLCVYTIKHSGDLPANRSKNTFHEKRTWVTAKRLLAEATGLGQRLPIIFCPAEETAFLFAWALVESVEFTSTGTNYTFSNLRHFVGKPIPKSRLRKRNGQSLSDRYIRPYSICQTPEFLKD